MIILYVNAITQALFFLHSMNIFIGTRKIVLLIFVLHCLAMAALTLINDNLLNSVMAFFVCTALWESRRFNIDSLNFYRIAHLTLWPVSLTIMFFQQTLIVSPIMMGVNCIVGVVLSEASYAIAKRKGYMRRRVTNRTFIQPSLNPLVTRI